MEMIKNDSMSMYLEREQIQPCQRQVFLLLNFLKEFSITWTQTMFQRYQTRQSLMDMNEFDFKDIGVTRMEAKVEMKKWFWQK